MAADLTYLSKEKRDIQKYRAQEIESGYEKQKYSWLNPLNIALSYRLDESAQTGSLSETQNAYINLSQDVFRSGGIYYTMQYARDKNAYDKTVLEQENAVLNQQLFTNLLTIRRSEYQIKQSEYRLKNKEIEIFIKRRQYEAGDVDITLLNNAIMDRNRELQILMSLKNTLSNTRIDMKKLTDRNEDEIALPHFSLAGKEDFLRQNYNIDKLQQQAAQSNDQYLITRSGYLPKLNLNGQYGMTEYQNRDLPLDYSRNSYFVGLQLSIPLDYTTGATVQEAKVAALKTGVQVLDRQREESASYEQIKSNIDNYQEYIELTKKNLQLYEELLEVTEAGVNAGYKAGYDLQTLRNTKTIDEYEIRINETNIQIELAKLHFLTKEASHEQ